MTRKTPIRHNVKSSNRRGRPVTSFDRGSGSMSSNPHGAEYLPPELEKFAEANKEELRRFSRDGLAKFFDEVGCQAVAREIRADRDVTGNAKFGLDTCVHSKTGAKMNGLTNEFIPQTAKGKRIEDQIIVRVNGLLKNGGYSTINVSRLRKQWSDRDQRFKSEIGARKKRMI